MKTDEMNGRLFATVPEVSRLLRADDRTIRRAIADGQIPGVRLGTTWRIPVAWLRTQALLDPPTDSDEAAVDAA
ncbi:helix-turn-helix domain-containing protein [Nonomuraea candida]|uniref:helix-turn-helix domain-containing protein n=1 Tax=Nonomuraea candida TaxID=359159 RepID=UPI0005BD35EA|nr:helix-turn-helix domain-containing protein [Nonomuraea candida]